MVELVKLEPWHMEVLKSEGYLDQIYVPGYSEYVCQGEAVAVFVDGKLVGAGGVIPQWEGVAEGWTVVTDWLYKHPVTLVKSFIGFFETASLKYRRIQITVEEGFEKAQRFAEYLGFTPEGRMLYYSPTGDTHIRYARIQ